jgi:hypothetical protein
VSDSVSLTTRALSRISCGLVRIYSASPGGGLRVLIIGDRPIAEYIAQLIAETVAQIGDHFIYRTAPRAVIAAVFHQSDRDAEGRLGHDRRDYPLSNRV